MLQHALNYLRKGYSVIPLKPKGKEPLIAWAEFQKRRASEQEVRNWFVQSPTANIGIVAGAISQIAIVDLDGPEGLESSNKLQLNSSVVVITGSGKHLWYRMESVISNAVRKFPGVDIRGEGGYIVVPPSIHPSGLRYRFLKPVLGATSLPPFPAEIFASSVSTEVKRNEPDWIVKALEEMTDGNIDDTLFRICSWFRGVGATKATCAAFIQPYAERVLAAPGHLEEKIGNVWGRYEPNTKGTVSLQSVHTGLVLHSPTNPDSLNEYDKRCGNGFPMEGIYTGYSKFDSLTKGLKRGEILTVAARTGVGKTNWILGPIKSFCENDKKALLFSTEMSFDQIWGRYRAILTDSQRFSDHKFFICDEFTPNQERIEEAIRQVNPDLFIFDHISHVGTEHHELAKFMMSLKELARRFNIPGIVTAQLNRSADWVENGERVSPRLSMIKGSGAIEEISAQVLLLSEKRIHADYTEIEGVVDKNRHGDKGIVSFVLKKNPYRIVEL